MAIGSQIFTCFKQQVCADLAITIEEADKITGIKEAFELFHNLNFKGKSDCEMSELCHDILSNAETLMDTHHKNDLDTLNKNLISSVVSFGRIYDIEIPPDRHYSYRQDEPNEDAVLTPEILKLTSALHDAVDSVVRFAKKYAENSIKFEQETELMRKFAGSVISHWSSLVEQERARIDNGISINGEHCGIAYLQENAKKKEKR